MEKRLFQTALLLALVAAAAVGAYGMGMGVGNRRHGMGGRDMMMAPPPSAGENPLPASEAVVARGKTVFDANCAICHGAQGRGDGPGAAALNPPPPSLLGAAAAWSDGQIAAQIQVGRGAMPAFRGALDSTAIWSVVHYLRRLQRP